MHARLAIVMGEGTPRICELEPSRPVTVGRSRNNSIILADERSSRVHARIYFENGQWMLSDNKTLNGTHVHGSRIEKPISLRDGSEFEIAGTTVRFNSSGALDSGEAIGGSNLETRLEQDDLEVLHAFMTRANQSTETHQVIRRALQTFLDHTGATVAGFIGLDEDNNPLPRVVLPEAGGVDGVLSKHLVQRVKEEQKTIWLKQTRPGPFDNTASLVAYSDAICLPVSAEGAPFAALHVYRRLKDFQASEVRFCEMVAGYLAHTLARLRTFRSLEAENTRLRRGAPASQRLIGSSAAMQQLRQVIAKAAACSSTVLIRGETGSGKELVALALHNGSNRHKGPFVVANCGAIPPTMLEAELFGYVRGAFTGAERDHPGFFEQADEGTLFLDEIGDMSLECQAKVLRALEAKAIRRVGAVAETHIDVRVIAASHKDLAREMKLQRFREDLYYRLRVICLPVPPLRDHAEDIPALVDKFLDIFAAEMGKKKRLAPAALKRLCEYSWPGNVRELRTVMESAVMLTDSEEIGAPDLWLQAAQGAQGADQLRSLRLEDVEAWAIREALKNHKGNLSAAARTLGISRESIAQKVKKYNIPRNGE